MNFDNWFDLKANDPPPGVEKTTVSTSHYMSIYVIFSILLKMRHQIGLEAMLEYLQKYKRKFKECYPQKGLVVEKEIAKIDVVKMYKNAMN